MIGDHTFGDTMLDRLAYHSHRHRRLVTLPLDPRIYNPLPTIVRVPARVTGFSREGRL